MKNEQYTCADVEALLQEMAKHDRQCCRMSDAFTEKMLRLIDTETKRVEQGRLCKSLAMKVACFVLLLSLCGLFISQDSAAPPSVATNNTAGTISSNGAGCENRVSLRKLDYSTESGFSPLPQKTYVVKSNLRYGVSVYGDYVYTACTDTL